ncbi:MAG UNVERIFIED_CONTAM: 4'-phosphopantetheinyl transferase superfamily protein [Planctomycetaceae bacterium]
MYEAGMIVGIGTDIVEIDRIRSMLERHGTHFSERCFTPPNWPGPTNNATPAPASPVAGPPRKLSSKPSAQASSKG